MHPRRRRLPDSWTARQGAVAATHYPRHYGPRRVHQPRTASGQVAESSRVEGQPGKPAAPAASPVRTEVPRHQARPTLPRPFRTRSDMPRDTGFAAVSWITAVLDLA